MATPAPQKAVSTPKAVSVPQKPVRPQAPVAGEAAPSPARRATPTPASSHAAWSRVEGNAPDPSEIPAFLRRRSPEDSGLLR